MTVTSVVTPLFSTPYLTLAEYKNAPTSVDIDNLVPGGSAAANAAELTNLIARASSQMDAYCQQVLAATVDTWHTRARLRRDGELRVHPRYFPIRQLLALSFGTQADAMNPITLDDSIWLEDRTIIVPAMTVAGAYTSGVFRSGFPHPYGPVLIAMEYVNGYPNTTLTADAAGTTLAVRDATGILAGEALNVYDEANGIQTAVVADTWTPTQGAADVPVTAAVTAANGTSVSGLPPAVKQAAIHTVTGLLKSRGAGSLTMSLGTTPGAVSKDGGAEFEFARARDLLTSFRRVW